MSPGGRLAKKVALVTGAASGIGKATAKLLAKQGAAVVITDIAAEPGQELAEEICREGHRAVFLPLDVSDEGAWAHVMDRVLRDLGRLDIAVNNAGIAVSRPVLDMTLAEWRRVLHINLDGVFLGTRYAIRAMQGGDGGSVINVASASGIKACAGGSAYCASKAAVRMFSKTAALECIAAGSRVRINVVSPGGVATPIWEKQDFWPGLVAQHGSRDAARNALASGGMFAPEAIAQAILFLASDESRYLNASELVIDAGYTA